MDITIATPALLFPAISLLLLAYTNRFLTLANLIRELHAKYKANQEEILLAQIKNLRYRLILIKDMQIFGVSSFFLCVATMFVLLVGAPSPGWSVAGRVLLGASLMLLLISLGLSLRELFVSIDALNVRLSDIEGLGER